MSKVGAIKCAVLDVGDSRDLKQINATCKDDIRVNVVKNYKERTFIHRLIALILL
jgi:hypothetical protein